MKKYYVVLFILATTLQAGRRSAQERLEHAIGLQSYTPAHKANRYRTPTPFPHHVVAFMEAGHQYLSPESPRSFTFEEFPEEPLPTADPIPETSVIWERRKNKKPFNTNPQKTFHYERPMTRLHRKRAECAQCTASYCQGQGWCPEHKKLSK